MWAAPAGALKPSSRRRRATWAWTNTRPAPRIKYGAGSGRVGITTSPCALLAGAFLLTLQQDGGKRCP